MVSEQIADLIGSHLPFTLTPEQREAALRLGAFIADPRSERCFALRGYAGTGKTSLIGALVKVLKEAEIPVVLLAPTGRAAKVFSLHAGAPAHTIHRIIYRQETFRGQDTPFQLAFNKQRHTVYIVDEASMIASGTGTMGDSLFGSGELLDDLIRYVYEGAGNRLLLVGDTAQLPPVGEDESPALQRDVLLGYGLLVSGMQLTQVVRQEEQSAVLENATALRTAIAAVQAEAATLHASAAGIPVALPPVTFGGEVERMPGGELIEALYDAYGEYGTQGTIVVTRSNKQANIYNNGIRARIFDREEPLTRGDLVMAVKNNYYWLKPDPSQSPTSSPSPSEPPSVLRHPSPCREGELPLKEASEPSTAGAFSPSLQGEGWQGAAGSPDGEGLGERLESPGAQAGFIANGDVAEVTHFRNEHEQYGFRFADATLYFPDYDEEVECRVMLSTLQSESPSLTHEEQSRLYEAVLADYAHLPSKRERLKAVREDPYYNALQIKYAYAVTCHKAQGGQWPRVFVDQGYIAPEAQDISHLRWLYTAFTRTTDKLFLINWRPSP